MIAAGVRAVVVPLNDDDERSLLTRLEALLELEEGMIAARDASGLVAIAEEREQVTARLGAAARARRLSSAHGDEADLVSLYTRLRQRHEIRARVVQRHEERNACAASVIAQATGQGSLYDAAGRGADEIRGELTEDALSTTGDAVGPGAGRFCIDATGRPARR